MAIYSEFSNQKWWFSIVVLVYQRVLPSLRKPISGMFLDWGQLDNSPNLSGLRIMLIQWCLQWYLLPIGNTPVYPRSCAMALFHLDPDWQQYGFQNLTGEILAWWHMKSCKNRDLSRNTEKTSSNHGLFWNSIYIYVFIHTKSGRARQPMLPAVVFWVLIPWPLAAIPWQVSSDMSMCGIWWSFVCKGSRSLSLYVYIYIDRSTYIFFFPWGTQKLHAAAYHVKFYSTAFWATFGAQSPHRLPPHSGWSPWLGTVQAQLEWVLCTGCQLEQRWQPESELAQSSYTKPEHTPSERSFSTCHLDPCQCWHSWGAQLLPGSRGWLTKALGCSRLKDW